MGVGFLHLTKGYAEPVQPPYAPLLSRLMPQQTKTATEAWKQASQDAMEAEHRLVVEWERFHLPGGQPVSVDLINDVPTGAPRRTRFSALLSP